MDDELKAFLDSKFHIPPIEGEDKVCSLREAVSKHVRPGQSIHIANKGGALFFQLVREFWGKKPDFTLISPSMSAYLLALIRGNMIKKAIISFAGNSYPAPGPNPHVQKAYISGSVEFENWTMLTLTQRLQAGAMGWEFIPTRSLIGSSMAEENKDNFMVIDSPFGTGEKTGLLRALRPDVTLVHGLAADRSGNTILPYPLGTDAYGAWASKEGVIVSVEHIVPTDYIRSHGHLVRIPSYMVKAVCEVPYGAHPGGLPNNGIPQFEGYFDDYEFVTMIRDASMDENNFMGFIQEWILNIHNNEQYLEKLGKEKLRALKDKAKPHSWVVETLAAVPQVEFEKESNRLERMVIAGSRYIADLCKTKGYRTILSGVGLANLAAWLAAYRLKDEKYDAELVAEIGMFGYLPRPSDPTIFSMHNLPTCKMLTNIETALGVLVGGSANSCLGVLGAAQVDKYGNGNSTKVPNVFYIVGSGGANDVASACREAIVFASSGKERLPEKVPYITFPGDNVKTLITDVGIFEKLNGKDTFTLTAYIPYGTAIREDEAIKGIRRLMGWEIDVAPQLKKIDLPSYEEKMLVRLFDPQGFYTKV
jgi:acyl CoA:acetate/3-ketoacid CoA transferase alpha subunit/acyl CoA:acetate/3-ketoacid CoA transferase beta subunit